MTTPNTLAEAHANRLALTAKETAQALGISNVTLWRLQKRGLIRPCRALRTPLFSLSEIERFLRESSGALD
jgi:predicted site-specific integrase-resolvase